MLINFSAGKPRLKRACAQGLWRPSKSPQRLHRALPDLLVACSFRAALKAVNSADKTCSIWLGIGLCEPLADLSELTSQVFHVRVVIPLQHLQALVARHRRQLDQVGQSVRHVRDG
jgi:hypothetical protein